MLAPVPEDGLPPAVVQANVYGVVPPVPVAVNVTAVPAVPVVGPLMLTARAMGVTVTAWDTMKVCAVGVEESVIVRATV